MVAEVLAWVCSDKRRIERAMMTAKELFVVVVVVVASWSRG